MTNQNVNSPVVWVDVPCVDLDRAIKFYSRVLACEIPKQEVPGFAMGIFPHGDIGAGGCLAVMKDTKPSETGLLVYMSCDGRLDEAVSLVEANGGKVLEPKHQIGPHGFRAIIKDSEGNRVALHSK
jgi:predicted enzyme related to lactoylglutathione lyase